MTKWAIGYYVLGILVTYTHFIMNPIIVEKIIEKIVYVKPPINANHPPEKIVYIPGIIPKPIAVPVIRVESELLEELKVYNNLDSTRRTVLDCDKERQSDRIALACNIYHEARDQSDLGQIAVALVTRNRVKSKNYPNTFSDVIWEIRRSKKTKQKVAQFSWALDGYSDKVRDKIAWIKAWNIAGNIIIGRINDFTNGALWYHTKKVKPSWRNQFEVAIVIGDHIFYKQ